MRYAPSSRQRHRHERGRIEASLSRALGTRRNRHKRVGILTNVGKPRLGLPRRDNQLRKRLRKVAAMLELQAHDGIRKGTSVDERGMDEEPIFRLRR